MTVVEEKEAMHHLDTLPLAEGDIYCVGPCPNIETTDATIC